MKVLVACDKFKGSSDAHGVCDAITKGIIDVHADYIVTMIPMADGGDGTMKILKNQLNLRPHKVDSIDALGRPIRAIYYTSEETAYIELAEASGIARLDTLELSPLLANAVGTGLLIKDAITNGYQKVVLSVGGSASTECGLSIAHSLGWEFLDHNGRAIIPSGSNLLEIKTIEPPSNELNLRLSVLCDVDNPLYGPNGAAYIYAPQKGASETEVQLLDQSLRHISALIESTTSVDISDLSGGGAAGGIAAGLHGLLNAHVINGFDYLSDRLNLEDHIRNADLVITGEGKLDQQSLSGKVVGSVAAICQKYKKELIVIVGTNELSQTELSTVGISEIYTIIDRAQDTADAIDHAQGYLREIGSVVLSS